jgi:predicted O-linked N-acetylglucosamine transferase (SPINDLY family)
MGVPVVTLAGDRHAARVGASLLTAIGHPEWIAASEEDYVQIACALAADAAGRRELRGSLREQLRASPLLDHAGQARRFGAAIRAGWRDVIAIPECARQAAVAAPA